MGAGSEAALSYQGLDYYNITTFLRHLFCVVTSLDHTQVEIDRSCTKLDPIKNTRQDSSGTLPITAMLMERKF